MHIIGLTSTFFCDVTIFKIFFKILKNLVFDYPIDWQRSSSVMLLLMMMAMMMPWVASITFGHRESWYKIRKLLKTNNNNKQTATEISAKPRYETSFKSEEKLPHSFKIISVAAYGSGFFSLLLLPFLSNVQ